MDGEQWKRFSRPALPESLPCKFVEHFVWSGLLRVAVHVHAAVACSALLALRAAWQLWRTVELALSSAHASRAWIVPA
jgi:hypothetical protein